MDALSELGAVIELTSDTWDDYGHRTTLAASLIQASGAQPLGRIKLLIRDEVATAAALNRLISEGWDGFFPLPNADYVSIPTGIAFYEELGARLGGEEVLAAAMLLRDGSLMTRLIVDEAAIAMTQLQPFGFSLLRERGAQRAFNEGWKLFNHQGFEAKDVTFRFQDRHGELQKLDLIFSPSLLPHDINVLVGPNGSGKSQLLRQLVDHWLQVGNLPEQVGFSSPSDFSQIVAVSYSPFEQMRVDTAGLQLVDHDIYRYFGLRGRPSGKRIEPTLSLDHAKRAAARGLIACAIDDQRFAAIEAWSHKLHTLHAVLSEAIEFDYAAIEVPATMASRTFQQTEFADDVMVRWETREDGDVKSHRGVRIDPNTLSDLNCGAITRHVDETAGVWLFKDGEPLLLSSGQQLFAYIVINLLGSIRRNSLVIIDEPELFLHPTLEIALVGMLKSILEAYFCKALIATHSLVVVREVPRECVHVLEVTKEGLFIKHPPFQTLGGDIQRISSYVFGDRSVTKPFERWIDENAEAVGGRQELLAQLAPQDLNEELILELRAVPTTSQ